MTVDVAANLGAVQERIARAARNAGRRAEEVLLVAVSKSVDAERIRQAIAAGVPALGENRVQEARGKISILGRQVPWHLVGRLQTNKAKDAVVLFDMIHSLDRVELGRELDRRSRALGKVLDVLVEVNVSAEATKGGFLPDRLKDALETLAPLAGIRLRGLMTMPPLSDDPEASRPWFRQLRELAAEARGWGLEGVEMTHLSMGMSGDFEVAVAEGATIVRIGTAIFGPRD
ncbi:MAG: YggS family pyridoxal phosphate-dependent enzyme [Candidatus Rokubacteria bacterium]|nr:YggS family pyridoxal phosphate-dependent enzyme [Candidatus Rokubacteria bacterium]